MTSHIAKNREPLPAQASPGIGVQTVDRVQPPGLAITPLMDRDKWTVAAVLARNSTAPVPRSGSWPDRARGSVLIAVVVAHPGLGIVGILVPALGHQVEDVVRAVQHVDATGVARVRVEHGPARVLVKHASALTVRHAG